MLARYINLKEAHERRDVLERHVEALPARDWQVQRFEAIHSSVQACQQLTGRIAPAEKACLLSHRSLLTEMLKAGVREPFMVWEDDVEVGACAHQAVMSFVSRTDPAQWDVLFTDLIVPDLLSMLQLLVRGRPLRTRKEVEILELSRMSFAGASAYLVNPLSLAKVTGLLHASTSLDEPYDLLLRRLIHEGKIKGNALFPFVTTVSEGSLASQIQQRGGGGVEEQTVQRGWVLQDQRPQGASTGEALRQRRRRHQGQSAAKGDALDVNHLRPPRTGERGQARHALGLAGRSRCC
jgi:GR25 family glycosyltransferase involved in LPS biosynthesis